MDIGAILSRSWEIFKKYKALWIFGILASCNGSGNGGGNSRFSRNNSGQANFPPGVEQFFARLTHLSVWVYIVIGLVVLLLVVVSILLTTVGRIGLFKGTQQADQGAARISFGQLFRDSLPYFWRVFGLDLLVGIAILLVALLIGGGFFVVIAASERARIMLLLLACLIPLVCVFIVALWIVGLVVTQAAIAIVTEGRGIISGLQRGWEILRKNAGTIIIMFLILGLGIGGVGGLIIGLPIVFTLLPLLAALASGSRQAVQGLLVTGLCFAGYLPVLIFLRGLLQTYIDSAWTLTFLRLTGVVPPAAADTPEPIVAPQESDRLPEPGPTN